jgi:RimJ/RimL family protein N-acetyltransferase
MRCLAGRASSRAEVEQAHQRRLAAAHGVPGLGFWAGFTDGDFVGWWILQPPNGPDQPKIAGEADLGYRLLRRHWCRGYASEGARALIRYGFADLGLHRIFAQTMALNLASRATMNAVGLTFTRAFISSEPYDDPIPGAEQGEVEHEITPRTWQRRQGSSAARTHTQTGDSRATGKTRSSPSRRIRGAGESAGSRLRPTGMSCSSRPAP